MSVARPSLAVVLLAAVAYAGSAAAQGDLAAIARKEKERRAKLGKPVAVLTEENGKEAAARGTGLITIVPGGAPKPSPSPGTREDPEAARASWKARADGARAAVTAAENAVKQQEAAVTAFRNDMAPVTGADALDPLRPQKREARIAEMTKTLETQRAAIVTARKALADLEDEARRAGVPPGWLR